MEIASSFDPLADLMIAKASRPAELGELELCMLSPFQRALLVLDGKVIKFIEAFTMEPLDIVRLSQDQRKLASIIPGWKCRKEPTSPCVS